MGTSATYPRAREEVGLAEVEVAEHDVGRELHHHTRERSVDRHAVAGGTTELARDGDPVTHRDVDDRADDLVRRWSFVGPPVARRGATTVVTSEASRITVHAAVYGVPERCECPRRKGKLHDVPARRRGRRRCARPLGRRLAGRESRARHAVRLRGCARDARARPGPGRLPADPRDRDHHRRRGRRRAGADLPRRRRPDRAGRVLPRRRLRHGQHRADGQRRPRARARIRRGRRLGRVPARAGTPVPGRARRLRTGDALGVRERGAVRRVAPVRRRLR